MKAARILAVGTFFLAASFAGAEIKPGDSLVKVVNELGRPRGYIHAGSYLLLDYELGKVELHDKVVKKADLMTEEELAAYKVRRAEQQEQDRILSDLRRAQRIEEGTRVLSAKLNDPFFAVQSGEARLAYWRSFRARYPEIDVSAEYSEALREYQVELVKQERDVQKAREIAELEQRVAAAESAARDAYEAQQRAESYARYAGNYGYSYGYSRGYGYPIGYPSVVCAPKKINCAPVPVTVSVKPKPTVKISASFGASPCIKSSVPYPYANYGQTIGWLAYQ